MARQYKDENAVKAHVRQLLTEFGWKHWPNAAGPHSVAGIPDRMAIKAGRFLAVECKGATGKVTALQANFQFELAEQDAHVWTVHPGNIQAFTEWLKLMDNDEKLAK